MSRKVKAQSCKYSLFAELEIVEANYSRLDAIYQAAKGPDVALKDEVDLYTIPDHDSIDDDTPYHEFSHQVNPIEELIANLRKRAESLYRDINALVREENNISRVKKKAKSIN